MSNGNRDDKKAAERRKHLSRFEFHGRFTGYYDEVPQPKGKVGNLFEKFYASAKSNHDDTREGSSNGEGAN